MAPTGGCLGRPRDGIRRSATSSHHGGRLMSWPLSRAACRPPGLRVGVATPRYPLPSDTLSTRLIVQWYSRLSVPKHYSTELLLLGSYTGRSRSVLWHLH